MSSYTITNDNKDFPETKSNDLELEEDVKEFGIKSKKYIEGFISKMKKLFKEIVDYLKR